MYDDPPMVGERQHILSVWIQPRAPAPICPIENAPLPVRPLGASLISSVFISESHFAQTLFNQNTQMMDFLLNMPFNKQNLGWLIS